MLPRELKKSTVKMTMKNVSFHQKMSKNNRKYPFQLMRLVLEGQVHAVIQ